MMSADAIREAMAWALCVSFYGTPWEGTSEFRRGICDNMADAALATLPVTAAQMAEIVAGRAVVVPVEATEGIAVPVEVMRTTLLRVIGPRALAVFDEEMDRAMIAAAPREGKP